MTEYDELKSYLDLLKQYYAKESGKREKIIEQLKENNEKIASIEKQQELLEQVNILLQKTSQFAREQAKVQVENLVTNCLEYIFENNTQFKIEINEAYKKQNAEFYVITNVDGEEIKTKPTESRGGGVVDIVSLALRISFLQIHRPFIEGPLILDEPAKHVSEEYIFNVANFLKKTSEMFNRQIIMVTHNNHLSAIGTNAYKVELKGTESIVEKLTFNL
ncbi:MAG TPA: ATPase [Tissierellales bacterium]|nr:ATPase [Tissierellales bacterium]